MFNFVCFRVNTVMFTLLSFIHVAAIAAPTDESAITEDLIPQQEMVSLQDGDSTEPIVASCSHIKDQFEKLIEQLHNAPSLDYYVTNHAQSTQHIRSCIEALFASLSEPQEVRVVGFHRIILFIDEASDKSDNVRCVTMVYIVRDNKSKARGCSIFPRREFWNPNSSRWAREADCERIVPVCAQRPNYGNYRYNSGKVKIDANIKVLGSKGEVLENEGYATLTYDSKEGFNLEMTIIKDLLYIPRA